MEGRSGEQSSQRTVQACRITVRNTVNRKEKSGRGIKDGKSFIFTVRKLRKVLAFTLMGRDSDQHSQLPSGPFWRNQGRKATLGLSENPRGACGNGAYRHLASDLAANPTRTNDAFTVKITVASVWGGAFAPRLKPRGSLVPSTEVMSP